MVLDGVLDCSVGSFRSSDVLAKNRCYSFFMDFTIFIHSLCLCLCLCLCVCRLDKQLFVCLETIVAEECIIFASQGKRVNICFGLVVVFS